MTREELKAHCERQIQQFERIKNIMPVTLNDFKRYEEHKLILELLQQESILDKVRAEIIAESYPEDEESSFCKIVYLGDMLEIIDKYKTESEDKE